MAHYNLIFQGQIIEGASLDEVKSNVARLFKADAGKTAALFSGKPIVIKKNLDTEAAKKYLAVLKKAGAVVKAVKVEDSSHTPDNTPIEPVKAPPTTPASGGLSAGLASLVYNKPATEQPKPAAPTPPSPVSETVAQQEATTTETATPKPEKQTVETEASSGLQLAPANEGVLNESYQTEAVDIPDIGHLTMSEAETGSLEEFAHKPEPIDLPDISNLTMSEANSGSLEGFEQRPEPVKIPDISSLDVMEMNGTPLSSDSRRPEPVEIPDITTLSMSEAQEGSLEGLEIKPEPAEIPDISHLDIEKTEENSDPQGKATFQID